MSKSPLIERYFACIGAQKAGTTWLARTLARHDDIFITPVKEIHYFDHVAGLTGHLSDRKRRSRYRKYHQRMWTQWNRWKEHRAQGDWYRAYMRRELDDDWYASLFADRQGKTVAGEATPEYALIGKKGFRHMKALAPDARVIYIMRNPVSRAWSQLLHQCRARRLNPARVPVEAFLSMAAEPRFEAIADYLQTLDDIDTEFGSSRALLAFYEDLHDDRAAALRNVCDFLGVGLDDSLMHGLGARYNISPPVPLPNELSEALRMKYGDIAEGVASRMGRIPESWQADFK
mgnify:CR=1 FL=1